MAVGFFQPSLVTSKPPQYSTLPKCDACGLKNTCKSPKMPVSGKGRKGILVVAEAPGADEDDQGTQLVGQAGRLFRDVLAKYDVDLDFDCWKTNSLICRPPENRTPTPDEIDYCRPNLINTIKELKPRMIMPLGAVAIRSLLGPIWREDVGGIGQWVGWQIPLQRYNTWVVPNYHPSYILRSENTKGKERDEAKVTRILFERYLKSALKIEGRPWETVPDYPSQIKLIYDPTEAARWIDDIIARRSGIAAIDYETNRLKPDHRDAEIVCCSISWNGEDTIAYPWVGEAIEATRRFILSPIPKVGSNIKFENRWSMRMFGHPVENWVWDCMTDGHILDNRDGITSVKFQSFVRTGTEPWNIAVEPFLSEENDDEGANGRNRIHLVDLRTLLQYCGMDALCEILVAKHQRKEMQSCKNL
jgi:uracil-DNA glycosylase family 4